MLHQINEACIAAGLSEYGDNEIQPIATLLALANAPEALYMSVKLGVEGIGELLRRSISSALSRYSMPSFWQCYYAVLVWNWCRCAHSCLHMNRHILSFV